MLAAARDRFSVLFLWIAGAVFVATGLEFFVAPDLMGAIRENPAGASPDAINDVRAIYGGLELGLGLFLGLCALRPSRYEAGFLAALATGASMALARFVGFAIVEGTSAVHLAYGALGLVGAAFALLGLRRIR